MKPKAIVLHALPLAWELVKSVSTTGAAAHLKEAATDFVAKLYELMGSTLIDHAASAPASSPQFVESVKQMSKSATK